MPMELRKRKAPPPPPPATGKKPTKMARTAAAVKETVKEKAAEAAAGANGSAPVAKPPAVGDIIDLDGFGGEVETNDGTKTTLKALVDESEAGVVLFTYPKASTPGCTKQACLFRDAYDALTSASGLAIYGLSADSPKANTAFRERQRLPYPLLCDPRATLLAAVGLRKGASPRGGGGGGAARGVFVVDKAGRVLAAQTGSPDGTLAVVRQVVEALAGAGAGAGAGASSSSGGGGSGGEDAKEKVAEAVEEAEKVEAEREKVSTAEEGEEEKEEKTKKGDDVPVAEVEKAAATNGNGKAEEEEKGEVDGEGEKKE